MYYFNEDINILTGKNGCGKTTLMKLMWYLISFNFEKLYNEVDVEFAKITSFDDSYYQVNFKKRDLEKTINIKIYNSKLNELLERDFYHDEIDIHFKHLEIFKSSLFFPTFRRIEGGFNIERNRRGFRNNSLRESLEEISESLSQQNHRFITSISTDDIENLISKKYADISFKIRNIENQQSREILELVARSNDKEKETLGEIRNVIKKNNKSREEYLKPFTLLDSFVKQVFKEKSIRFNRIFFGEESTAILSDKLSAGEKQMLSFMCYNFFFDNCIIFIDEPELSLHTDWQRILFTILLKQEKNNQFIIATHSPFIYSKYPSKEILIDNDRGTNL
ncbi:AAA family ATPase [Paenimyroides baculatum]|uniref:ATP-binding protein n=1 Tax=Paenimyroides baculatum TaxID=2608000 RepID=A0A5M6CDX3_9FLAO|nr:AAA family ATPase [Paenimyroides baculatum]KAA5531655.1 ATP-binding protein [Paenimyroides baculatum]